jgi:tetratricopeptide (TPR) repeat protein
LILDASGIVLQVRPNWTVLIPVLILAIALAIPTTYAAMWLYSRFVYLPRIRRRILALDQRRASDGIDAVRGDLAVWERHVSKRDANQLIVIARQWYVLGDHDRALAALDRIRWAWWVPDRAFHRAADELRYRVLRDAGRDPGADALLNRTIDRDPVAPWLDAVRFEKSTAAADPRERLAGYERARSAALQEHPHMEILAKVAAQAISLGRVDDAVLLSRRLLTQMQERERWPGGYVRTTAHVRNIARLRAAIGALLLGTGDEPGAEREFELAAATLAQDEEGRRDLAVSRAEGLMHARRFEEAASAFERLVAEGPDVKVLVWLAICRWRLADPDAARSAIREVRALEPDLTSIGMLEAMLLADEGKRDEAGAMLGSIGPEDEDSLAVAYVRSVLGLPGAERSLRLVTALYPHDDPDVAMLLDRVAPDGRPWRAHLDEPRRPDAARQPSAEPEP